LENIILDEIQAFDDIVVPSGMFKVQNEGQTPKQHFYANDLDNTARQRWPGLKEDMKMKMMTMMLTGIVMRSRMAMPAATAIAACL